MMSLCLYVSMSLYLVPDSGNRKMTNPVSQDARVVPTVDVLRMEIGRSHPRGDMAMVHTPTATNISVFLFPWPKR